MLKSWNLHIDTWQTPLLAVSVQIDVVLVFCCSGTADYFVCTLKDCIPTQSVIREDPEAAVFYPQEAASMYGSHVPSGVYLQQENTFVHKFQWWIRAWCLLAGMHRFTTENPFWILAGQIVVLQGKYTLPDHKSAGRVQLNDIAHFADKESNWINVVRPAANTMKVCTRIHNKQNWTNVINWNWVDHTIVAYKGLYTSEF